MASAAADGLFRPIYEGCIAGFDNDVERRPYHKNCGCALHSKSGSAKKACNGKRAKCNSVSYPMRRAWSEGSLLVMASSASGNSSPSSPACRPHQEEEPGHQQHHHHHHH